MNNTSKNRAGRASFICFIFVLYFFSRVSAIQTTIFNCYYCEIFALKIQFNFIKIPISLLLLHLATSTYTHTQGIHLLPFNSNTFRSKMKLQHLQCVCRKSLLASKVKILISKNLKQRQKLCRKKQFFFCSFPLNNRLFFAFYFMSLHFLSSSLNCSMLNCGNFFFAHSISLFVSLCVFFLLVSGFLNAHFGKGLATFQAFSLSLLDFLLMFKLCAEWMIVSMYVANSNAFQWNIHTFVWLTNFVVFFTNIFIVGADVHFILWLFVSVILFFSSSCFVFVVSLHPFVR